MTGQGSEAIASEAISADVTDYVRKGSGSALYREVGDQLRRAAVGYRARRRLRAQEARFGKLIEGSTDLISVLDDAGTVEYVSPAVTSILGYEPSDVVGTDAFEGHPEDRESVAEQFRAAVADPSRTPSAEFRYRAADGELRILEATGRNRLDDPDVGGFVVNASDVTECRARQRELRQQNERLEEFASVVSHDMRNPLSVAVGRLQLARDDCESEHLDAMAAAHDRMERLIEDLLTLAQQGQLVEEPTPVALEEVVSEALASIDADAEPAVSVEPVTVVADRERLLQAMENLLQNAVQYGPAGDRTASDDEVAGAATGATIRVGVPDDGRGFFVADDGPGASPGAREQVFDPGYTTSREGTGFSLSIVRSIVEAHGWDIVPTAGDDGGARFEVTGVALA